MDEIILSIIQMSFIVLSAPLAVGIVKKCKAFFQGRVGASIFLPYHSIATLFAKETLVSRTASYVYHIVPVFVFSLTIGVAFYVPIIMSTSAFSGMGSFFALAGLFMLSSVLLVLGGLDTGGVFGGMASSREMTIASLVEPAVLLSFGAIVLHSNEMSDSISTVGVAIWSSPSLALATLALVFVALAENARFPVDNPATHLELTMVHEGMILEYSGRQLALLEWASAMKLTIFAVIIANVVWPFGLIFAPLTVLNVTSAMIIALFKIAVVMFLLALLESTIAKMRFYRMQEYLSTAAMLGLSALIITLL